jgi:hemerythrin-like domain-containing protein
MVMFIFLPQVLAYTRLGPWQSGGIQIAEPE